MFLLTEYYFLSIKLVINGFFSTEIIFAFCFIEIVYLYMHNAVYCRFYEISFPSVKTDDWRRTMQLFDRPRPTGLGANHIVSTGRGFHQIIFFFNFIVFILFLQQCWCLFNTICFIMVTVFIQDNLDIWINFVSLRFIFSFHKNFLLMVIDSA